MTCQNCKWFTKQIELLDYLTDKDALKNSNSIKQ